MSSKSSKAKSLSPKSASYVRRRLLGIPGSRLNSRRAQSLVELNRPNPKKSSIIVRSVTQEDKNGEIKVSYNFTILEEETKNKKSSKLTIVEDQNLLPDGSLKLNKQGKLTEKSKKVDYLTRSRRIQPLIKSSFEDSNKNFHPAYSGQQVWVKTKKHTVELLKKLNANITKFLKYSENTQVKVSIGIIERLLDHPDTVIYENSMLQFREPGIVALNMGGNGSNSYSIPGHMATFERHPELYEYNSYISNYILKHSQIVAFDKSMNHSLTYEDVFGNLKTNIGPNVGENQISEIDTNNVNNTSITEVVDNEL
jgi:hypothetical protein